MLKLIGSLLIGTASVGLAWCVTGEMKAQLLLLYEIRQMLVDISGEASYSMQPMEVILGQRIHVKNRCMQKICTEISQRLSEHREENGVQIWRAVIEKYGAELGAGQAECEVFAAAGKAFFGKSTEENDKNLAVYLERLDFLIAGRRAEQKEKQRVVRTVSVMCGLMLILLLI